VETQFLGLKEFLNYLLFWHVSQRIWVF